MATGSDDFGLGAVQRGRNTPGLPGRDLAWLHYCPAEYLAGLLPYWNLISSVLIKGPLLVRRNINTSCIVYVLQHRGAVPWRVEKGRESGEGPLALACSPSPKSTRITLPSPPPLYTELL